MKNKQKTDFAYDLAVSPQSHSTHDFKIKKAKAWAACHQMKKIWKSDMKRILGISRIHSTLRLWTIPASGFLVETD